MGNRIAGALLTVALVSVAIGALWEMRAPRGPAPRLVLYFESEGAASRRLFAQFVAGLDARLGAGHAVRSEFVPVAEWDEGARRRVQALLERRPDAIVATSGAGASTMKSLAPSVPVVFATNGDPVAAGLVRDLNRPGGMLTGITSALPTFEKRIEILAEALPQARHVGVLMETGIRVADLDLADGKVTVGDRITFHWESAASEAEARATIAAASPRVDAWYIPYNGLAFFHGEAILEALAQARRPAIFERVKFADAGGLLAYQHTVDDPAGRLAEMTASVLQGVPPGEIPVVRPQRFELVVNLEAARRLGVRLPKAVVKRADRVIAQ